MVNAITTFRENTLRHAGLLKLREQELRTQNLRFEAALDNMSQGLSVYDGSQRLIVCNERYAQLCGLSEDVLTPGITLREVLQLRAKNGTFRWAEPHAPFDIDRALQDTLEMCTKGEPWTRTLNLVDGRIISISFQPMPDNGWVATHEDVTERQQAEARIKHLAHHDALTDLPNRLLLREQLENALASTAQSETLAVVLLDLDHFKDVNDTLGHPVGDELLKAVSTRLRSCVRQDEVNSIARLGGDEFAILQISARQPEAVTSLAQRIVEVVSAPYMFGDHQVFVGVSIGISLSPRDGSDPDQLLKNADIALYRAKAEGRNTFRFFEPEMDALTKARRQMELDLREALLREEFSVFYQPIVNLGRNEVCGLEALLRWKHPERGFVSPTEFIPVAEEMGLIIPIGEWVLRQACAEAARWPSNLKLAVNLSSIQFRSRNLVQTVVSALASSGLPAYRLELEITESVLLQNNKSNLATLHQLRGLGASISMDDFGTGHSSLSYLRSFPFDKIKIDSSFVGDMANSTDSVSIVRTIASLGNSLGITTTAEGVETQEQLEAVRAAGCTEVQGYFFSRPVPPEQIKTLLLSVGRAREAA
jgi:diguanylate cyclase (GGDEF)-like protein